MQQTLQRLILTSFASFKSDLVTTDDVVASLVAGMSFHPDLVFIKSMPQPSRIGPALKEIGSHYRVDARDGEDSASLWVIRNHDKWRSFTPAEMMRSYRASKGGVVEKTEVPDFLTVIK